MDNKSKNIKMKRTYTFGKILLAGLLVVGVNQSCTNLDEQLYDQVTPSKFLKGAEQFTSALGSSYSSLGGYDPFVLAGFIFKAGTSLFLNIT